MIWRAAITVEGVEFVEQHLTGSLGEIGFGVRAELDFDEYGHRRHPGHHVNLYSLPFPS